MPADHGNCCLAACIRFNILGLAIVSSGRVLKVKRRCLYHRRPTESKQSFATRAITKLANDFSLSAIVVEPGSLVQQWVEQTGLKTLSLTLLKTKEILLPEAERTTHVALLQHLVDHYPEARAVARILPITGKVAMTDRWRVPPLLAVALGLAWQQAGHH